MFVKAKKILASELMYAKGMDEDEAAEWLDDVSRRASATKKPAARRSQPKAQPPRRRHERRWAILAAAEAGNGSGWTDRRRSRRSNDGPLVAEPLERLDAVRVGRRDRDRGSARVGGAVHPGRRGGRRRARCAQCGHGRRDAQRVGACGLAEVPDARDRRPRPRRGAPADHGRGDRAGDHRTRRGLGRRRVRPCRSPTRSSESTATRSSRRSTGTGLVTAQTPQAFVAPVSQRRLRDFASTVLLSRPIAPRSWRRTADAYARSRAIRVC